MAKSKPKAAAPKKRRKKHKTRRKQALSASEFRFCELIANGTTASQAYRESLPTKATPESTWVLACRRLRKVKVREKIREFQDAASIAAAITITDLAKGFRRAEQADFRKILGSDGQIRPPLEWPDEIALCVIRFEVEELFGWEDDPDGGKRIKVPTGQKWKVWLENKTDCRKTLAQWRRMIGTEEKKEPEPKDPKKEGDSIELATRVAALIRSRQTPALGVGGTDGEVPDGDAVAPESGGTGSGVPE